MAYVQPLAEKVSASTRRIRQYAASLAYQITQQLMAGQGLAPEHELLRWLLCNLEALALPEAALSLPQKWELIEHVVLQAPISDHSLTAFGLVDGADIYDVKLVHWDEILDKPDLIEREEFEQRLGEIEKQSGGGVLTGMIDLGGAVPAKSVSLTPQ